MGKLVFPRDSDFTHNSLTNSFDLPSVKGKHEESIFKEEELHYEIFEPLEENIF